MATPARPPLDALKKRLDRSRSEKARLPRDGFLRETFVLPRTDARQKAREWFDRWPKQAVAHGAADDIRLHRHQGALLISSSCSGDISVSASASRTQRATAGWACMRSQ